jgi:phosphohistidine phosphatase
MLRLTLIRHAKSSWANPALHDHERPLSDRGLRDAPRMFARLSEHVSTPDCVISSDADRAAATATALIRSLSFPQSRLRLEPELYMASPQQVLDLITEQDDACRSLMIVGHNPTLTALANHLISELRLDNLPTCGVVGMEFDRDRWSQVRDHEARLIYLDYPKNTGQPVID